jgi:uncharacterized membrane protein
LYPGEAAVSFFWLKNRVAMLEERGNGSPGEARWPVVIVIAAVSLLLALLPDRIRVVPVWTPVIVAIWAIFPSIAVSLVSQKARWLKIERMVILVTFVLVAAATIANLTVLVAFMLQGSNKVTGPALLSSSVGVWVCNVLMFSLLYWQIDRGGPGPRGNGERRRPDWLFPQESAPPEDLPPSWRPTFVDYLFLAFSTATAFSPADILPLTHRAKVIVMIESSISLVTLVVVAARAINVLAS